MIKKIIGVNYLHNHPLLERKLKVPQDHVIVDRKDWNEIVELLIAQKIDFGLKNKYMDNQILEP